MRRVLVILLLGVVVAGSAFAAVGAGDDKSNGLGTYFVELDNAFGLIEGADVKIAGVRAGKIKSMKLDREDMRALIEVDVNQPGFDDIRQDVFCETRPQSLIGEYFIDCQPGKSKKVLPPGSTIPVEQTGSTVPVDLVNNIMRRPYRERFSILLSELGAGLAARGEDIDETIRRANPALREVDKLLAVLAEQKRTIANLYRDADVVIGELADNKKDVTRFVAEARDTSAASATRAGDIEKQFQRFPTFLRELRPTVRLLGEAADRQTPALRTLAENSPLLVSFFDALGPFSEASRPSFRTLAGAARKGRPAVRVARPQIAELRRGVDVLPELADNLAIVFEHIDDPKNTTEPDVRAGRGPNGGFTGLEALLRYVFSQSQAINVFDENSYMLKVNAFLDRDCANYAVVEDARDESKKRCRAWIGPNQPGINSPDPSQSGGARAARAARAARGGGRSARVVSRDDVPTGVLSDTPQMADAPSSPSSAPSLPSLPSPDRGVGAPAVPKGAEDVLDYLLGS